MSKNFNKGRDQGRKDGFIGSLLHNLGNTVTANLGGSKVQKEFNKGYAKGQRDRQQGGNTKKRY